MASMAETWVQQLFRPTLSPGHRTVHVRRPSPALVGEIGRARAVLDGLFWA